MSIRLKMKIFIIRFLTKRMVPPLSKDEFVSRAMQIHETNYDYTNSNYVDMRTHVQILCRSCGTEFEQLPRAHLVGRGCPFCANIRNGIRTVEMFVHKAKEIHGERYTYALEYGKYVIIECNACQNKISITPTLHILGHGCPCQAPIALPEPDIDFNQILVPKKERTNLASTSSSMSEGDNIIDENLLPSLITEEDKKLLEDYDEWDAKKLRAFCKEKDMPYGCSENKEMMRKSIEDWIFLRGRKKPRKIVKYANYCSKLKELGCEMITTEIQFVQLMYHIQEQKNVVQAKAFPDVMYKCSNGHLTKINSAALGNKFASLGKDDIHTNICAKCNLEVISVEKKRVIEKCEELGYEFISFNFELRDVEYICSCKKKSSCNSSSFLIKTKTSFCQKCFRTDLE